MTKLNYKSYELAALQTFSPLLFLSLLLAPSAALFRLTPPTLYLVSLPFSLHFYYDEPSGPLLSASFALLFSSRALFGSFLYTFQTLSALPA